MISEIRKQYSGEKIRDRGSYVLILKLESDKIIDIGQLGRFEFYNGYYIYVGSAMVNLQARIKRHESGTASRL